MIHYHGTPISPVLVLQSLAGRHFCVSYADPRDVVRCRALGQSLMLDNGAFSAWRAGKPTDWPGFYAWVEAWLGPADFAVIPDVIDGDETKNDALIAQWPHGYRGAPVWHLHEPFDRLLRLSDEFPLVCLGSSGTYKTIGTPAWEARMDAAFNRLCCQRWVTPRLHGLRMLACSGHRWPFASVDSSDIARNHNRPHNNAKAMAERWDAQQCPRSWIKLPEQQELAA